MAVRKMSKDDKVSERGSSGELGLRPDPALSRGLSCPGCSSTRVTLISMTLTDGTPVDFVSCHTCEHKHWRAADGTLALQGVLDRARKPR